MKSKRLSSDTRKILRQAVSKAIHTPNDRLERQKSPESNITVDETDSSVHINFHHKPRPRPSRRFYTKDGKLIQR